MVTYRCVKEVFSNFAIVRLTKFHRLVLNLGTLLQNSTVFVIMKRSSALAHLILSILTSRSSTGYFPVFLFNLLVTTSRYIVFTIISNGLKIYPELKLIRLFHNSKGILILSDLLSIHEHVGFGSSEIPTIFFLKQ